MSPLGVRSQAGLPSSGSAITSRPGVARALPRPSSRDGSLQIPALQVPVRLNPRLGKAAS